MTEKEFSLIEAIITRYIRGAEGDYKKQGQFLQLLNEMHFNFRHYGTPSAEDWPGYYKGMREQFEKFGRILSYDNGPEEAELRALEAEAPQ